MLIGAAAAARAPLVPVTSGGILIPSAAQIAAFGVSGSSGAGALAAQAAALAGVGGIGTLGSGLLNAAAAAIAGAGLSGSSGSGALAAQAAAIAGVGVYTAWATFDASDHSANITFSGGNRTASYSGTTTDAAARMSSFKTSGNYYFEFTVNNTLTGGDAGGGVARSDATLSNIANLASLSFIVYRSGNVWSNGGSSGKTLGSIATSGTIVGIAWSRTNGKGWARICPSGNWFGDAAANPATNTNGVTLPAAGGSGSTPVATFGGSGGTNVPNNFTFNVGQSAFSGTVPSGFTAGWPG